MTLLSDLKVVEWSTWIAGPGCAAVMADWRANVIKIGSAVVAGVEIPGPAMAGQIVRSHEAWFLNPDWWVAGFTGCLFIATLGLWIFTALLWKTTRKAVVDTEQSIKISSDMLEHARVASERQLRPYVFITSPDPIRPDGRYLSFNIHIKNFGQTPARKVKIWRGNSNIERSTANFEIPLYPESETCGDMAPGDDLRIVFNLSKLPRNEISDIEKGIFVSAIRLRVEYEYYEDATDFHDAIMYADSASIKSGVVFIATL